mmetsp:Transcript_17921/g.34676  ORF Transcript_17921/g.34676 Transcript_17921/m.34676 type:complete len:325 (-) Transcript_17921:170-1144(-)
MAADGAEGISLGALYAEGAALHAQVVDGSGDQTSVRRGASVLRRLSETVEKADLYSRNEALDDVATGDLKFLLARFYLGEVLMQVQGPDRVVLLKGAKEQFDAFLQMCESLGVLTTIDRELYRHEGPMDPGQKRDTKIARFKQERELKTRLDQIASRRQSGGEEEADDDEREAWVVRLQQSSGAAISHLDMIGQEMEVLAVRDTLAEGATLPRPPLATPQQMQIQAMLKDAAKDLQSDQRERIRAEVFRPTHTLPTYTVEQWGEIEHANMMHEQQQQKAAQQRNRIEEVDDDESDEAVLKARAWDDFKDDNPRGWGNSAIKPCR